MKRHARNGDKRRSKRTAALSSAWAKADTAIAFINVAQVIDTAHDVLLQGIGSGSVRRCTGGVDRSRLTSCA